MAATPQTPSRQERLEHELTHQPPVNWCEDRVRGWANAIPHQHPLDRSQSKILVANGDCTFLNKAEEDMNTLTAVAKPPMAGPAINAAAPTAATATAAVRTGLGSLPKVFNAVVATFSNGVMAGNSYCPTVTDKSPKAPW